MTFEIYRGLSRSIEKRAWRADSRGKCLPRCLSRSIEIYRWDAHQFDGKSDGKNVAQSSRRKSTVRSIFELTVNLECEVQHPCGFPGDRRIGRADGKFPRSQAIRHSGASRFVAPRRARQWKGRGRDDLPVVDLWKYIINGNAPPCTCASVTCSVPMQGSGVDQVSMGREHAANESVHAAAVPWAGCPCGNAFVDDLVEKAPAETDGVACNEHGEQPNQASR